MGCRLLSKYATIQDSPAALRFLVRWALLPAAAKPNAPKLLMGGDIGKLGYISMYVTTFLYVHDIIHTFPHRDMHQARVSFVPVSTHGRNKTACGGLHFFSRKKIYANISAHPDVFTTVHRRESCRKVLYWRSSWTAPLSRHIHGECAWCKCAYAYYLLRE